MKAVEPPYGVSDGSASLARTSKKTRANRFTTSVASDKSYVNLNRAGTPLLEIVSEPDFRSSWEAYDYVNFLRRTLQYIGVCDGNMEEGNLRCDANVSVRRAGDPKLGVRAEIKNVNSLRFLQKAIDYEIDRQITVLETGGKITQETRLWNEKEGKTYTMRSKEDAHDYRYFPEPDLPPLEVSNEWIDRMRDEQPELPEARRQRFMRDYDLNADESFTLTGDAQAGRLLRDRRQGRQQHPRRRELDIVRTTARIEERGR